MTRQSTTDDVHATTGERARRAPVSLSGRAARQGTINLRKPWQRWVFFGGVAGFAVLALVLATLWAV